MAYGLITYKDDGTTVVLQNSTKSGQYAGTAQANATGTAGTMTTVSFPQFAGRSLRPIQLVPGVHSWSVSGTTITFTEKTNPAATSTIAFSSTTVLYVYVK